MSSGVLSRKLKDNVHYRSAAFTPRSSSLALMFLCVCISQSVCLSTGCSWVRIILCTGSHSHHMDLRGCRQLLDCAKFENRLRLTGYEHVELNRKSLNCTAGSNYWLQLILICCAHLNRQWLATLVVWPWMALSVSPPPLSTLNYSMDWIEFLYRYSFIQRK